MYKQIKYEIVKTKNITKNFLFTLITIFSITKLKKIITINISYIILKTFCLKIRNIYIHYKNA